MSRRRDRSPREHGTIGTVTKIVCSDGHEWVNTGVRIVDRRNLTPGAVPALEGHAHARWSTDGRRLLPRNEVETKSLRPYERDWDAEDAGTTNVAVCPRCGRRWERREDRLPLAELLDIWENARPGRREIDLRELEALVNRLGC